jgi:hypothetical protein
VVNNLFYQTSFCLQKCFGQGQGSMHAAQTFQIQPKSVPSQDFSCKLRITDTIVYVHPLQLICSSNDHETVRFTSTALITLNVSCCPLSQTRITISLYIKASIDAYVHNSIMFHFHISLII